MVTSIGGGNTIMPVEPAIINNPNDKYVLTKPYSIVFKGTAPPMSAECINANPPCQNPGGLPPRTVYFKAGQSIGEEMVKVHSIPMSVLAPNPMYKPIQSAKGGTKEQSQRDVLEGGLLTMLFPGYGGANYRLVFRWALVILIIFLIVKYGVPYFKKQFAK